MAGQDPVHGVSQRFYRNIRIFWPLFGVFVVDEVGSTARLLPGGDVPPSIPDHDTRSQIDPEVTGSIEQEARARLAACAVVSINMAAHPEAV